MAYTRPLPRPVSASRSFLRTVTGGRFAARVVLVAAFALLGQVASLAHLALVQHTRCLEHDALVHAPGGEAAQTVASSATTAPIVAAVPSEAADHGDDHCLIAGLRRRDVSASATPAPADLPAAQVVLTPAGQQPADSHPIPLLARAPKSSPPATA